MTHAADGMPGRNADDTFAAVCPTPDLAEPGSPPASADAPVAAVERLTLLDALRGFALAGVLLANLRDYSLYGLLDDDRRAQLATAPWDHWLDAAVDLLVSGKAMTLFALLFGVGFALQLSRTPDAAGRWRFARRMLALFALGTLHAWLFWWGDILRYYALLGLLLLACHRWPARWLVWSGLFVTLLATSLLHPFMTGWSSRFGDGAAIAARALEAFSHGDWLQVVQANFARDVYWHLATWSLVFFTLGRLLLGAGIGRAGWLTAAAAHRRQWLAVLRWCLPLGLLLTLFFLLQDRGLVARWMFGLEGMPARMLSRLLRNTAYLATGLGYLAAFVLAWLQPRWRSRLALFAPLGRMALTHYVTQTVVGVWLFYGMGLGIGPRFGIPGVLLAFALVFAAQLWISRWWLARFRFGPLEWAWRSLTYLRPQPMRMAQA